MNEIAAAFGRTFNQLHGSWPLRYLWRSGGALSATVIGFSVEFVQTHRRGYDSCTRIHPFQSRVRVSHSFNLIIF